VIAGVEAEIRHVADSREIIANAILSTPGLVIDGKVVSTGRIPTPAISRRGSWSDARRRLHRNPCIDSRREGWRPHVFGNVGEQGILDLWNGAAWREFRGDVTRYDFPFCYDCNVAMCDYVEDGNFEQDCHVGKVPCAACLWCRGPFQCLR
jgi:hypothetical protein